MFPRSLPFVPLMSHATKLLHTIFETQLQLEKKMLNSSQDDPIPSELRKKVVT